MIKTKIKLNKKDYNRLIKLAKKEIKEWNQFLLELEKMNK